MYLLTGIIPQLHHRYEMGVSGTKASWLAIDTDHFASTVGDAGWGCGYRNLQMLISALLKMEIYRPVMLSGECSRILGCLDTICANHSVRNLVNLIPRSLVDEAQGEIGQVQKFNFSFWLECEGVT